MRANIVGSAGTLSLSPGETFPLDAPVYGMRAGESELREIPRPGDLPPLDPDTNWRAAATRRILREFERGIREGVSPAPNLDDALFYSPFPGLDVMRRDNAFVSAYRQKNNAEPDDIGAAIYGLEKLVGAMLVATGKDLSRESFQATIAQRKKFETGVFPPTSFTSRFGGTAMHLLRADCGAGEFVTVRQNERP